jgi:sterol desaturase/sphingolipid hydroxylase (fatty acid hydroxylase superfamily)
MAHVEYEVLPLVLTFLTNKISYLSTGSEHLAHHKYFNCNYGFAKYLDKFFGTYKEFNKLK